MSRPRTRLLLIASTCVLALPLLAWGVFRIWLATQPEDFRAQIEQFSPLEFVAVVRDTVRPPPVDDRGAWGRRLLPGRGDAPWVRRHSLDGRPRMLSIAPASDIRLAYSTETASVHRLWRGDIEFTGPVYDARHGREPQSTGVAWWSPPSATAWQVEVDGTFEPARVQWRGHGFDGEDEALWLRFDLLVDDPGTGRPRLVRSVTEWPEIRPHAGAPGSTSSDDSSSRRRPIRPRPRSP